MEGFDSPKRRDPTIKLFGRRIQLLESQISTKPLSHEIAKEENKVSCEPDSVTVEEQSEVDGTEQEKAFKKPDKILPCPRCYSLDTKFCYFNNYNVNQPRHFCKSCQRYWTAGGTIRSVPVGSGRRKNKQFASQYHQILVSSDGSPVRKIETTDSENSQVGKGSILSFGAESLQCESMDTMLHLGDQRNVANTAGHGQELSACRSSALETSSSCSNDVTVNVMTTQQAALARSSDEVTPQCKGSIPLYPFRLWSFPFSTGWGGVQFCPAPMVAVPGEGYPPNTTPLQLVTSSSRNSGSCLGKRSRDSADLEELQVGKYILVPRTLELDETDAASKCPVIATFGFISDQATGFKGFGSKLERLNNMSES